MQVYRRVGQTGECVWPVERVKTRTKICVRAILSSWPSIWHFYIVYNIHSLNISSFFIIHMWHTMNVTQPNLRNKMSSQQTTIKLCLKTLETLISTCILMQKAICTMKYKTTIQICNKGYYISTTLLFELRNYCLNYVSVLLIWFALP